MPFTDEVLIAYADGELAGEQRAQVEHAIKTDPRVARRLAQHQALGRSVQGAFARVLDEPVPQRLIAAAYSASIEVSRSADASRPQASKLASLRRAPPVRWSLPQWAAIAASLLLGAGVWQLIERGADPLVAQHGGRLVAVGALAQALSNQLVAAQTARSPVQIGISFRSRSGNYCRTFQVPSDSYAGIACRDEERWGIQLLGANDGVPSGSSSYRQAASPLPPWLAQQVEHSIAGEPLDSQAEARARADRWRSQPSSK